MPETDTGPLDSGGTADGGASVDLVVRGGTVVTADSESRADVGVREGVVVQLGGAMTGRREIDASGLLVLPGGIDMHVHLEPTDVDRSTPVWADDFASGSRAAAAGGITTIGDMVFPEAGELPLASIERMAADAERVSVVDFVLHPVLLDPRPEVLGQIPELARLGHSSIKVFTVAGDFGGRAGEYLAAIAEAGRSGVLSMVHCEDAALVEHATATLLAEGNGGLEHFAETRPAASEWSAVSRVIAFAETVGAPVYLVHLGGARALAAGRDAQARGVLVWLETRPIYLHFTRDVFAGPNGPLFVGEPPIGTAEDSAALWSGLAAGHIHTVCTDHAAWTKEHKLDPAQTVASARPGVSDLETMLPMLFDRGVGAGRLTRQRFVEITSTNAAKLFGMFPRKGTVSVGSDADLTLWDPQLSRTVDGSAGFSRAGHSLHDGWTTTGWPVTTISRGEVVYEGGQVIGRPGGGRLVRRGPTRPL